MLSDNLYNLMLPHLKEYKARVTASGIRYGSVAYIAFGQGIITQHKSYLATKSYPVEIEFGADYWSIIQNGRTAIESNFHDIQVTRKKIESLLVDRTIRGIFANDSDKITCETVDGILISQ